jgi:hypothetical protein
MIYIFDHNAGYLLNEGIFRFTDCKIYEPSISLGDNDILLYCKYFHNYTRFRLLSGDTNYEQISKNKNEQNIDEPIEPDKGLREVLEQKNGYLFLCNTWEYFPLFSGQFQDNLSRFITYLNIPLDKVIISCCDSGNIGKTINSRIKAFGFDWSYIREKLNFNNEKGVNTLTEKHKHFIFLNRRYSDDRFLLFLYIMYKNYSDRCYLSFLSQPPLGSLNQIDRLVESMDLFDSSFPGTTRFMQESGLTLPIEMDGGKNDIDWAGNSGIMNEINDSYFFIINESICDSSDYLFISEKTYKAIRHGMPFLLFGSKGILTHLHNLGFKTFHPFIDESYDHEQDYARRLNLFIKEIDRLCRLSSSEIKQLYGKILPAVRHNIEHLKKTEKISLLENEINRLVTPAPSQ